MKLGDNGEAFFVEELEEHEVGDEEVLCPAGTTWERRVEVE